MAPAAVRPRLLSTKPHDDSVHEDGKAPKRDGAGEKGGSDKSATGPAATAPINLDIDTTDALIAAKGDEPEGKRTNARRRQEGTSSIERNRRILTRTLVIGSSLLVGYAVWMLGRDFDQAEMDQFHDQSGLDSFLGRLKFRVQSVRDGMTKPVWDKLLPDPLPFPYSRPYTLVLDLDQLLVASSWSTSHGWRIAKRPGLDYFLGYLSQWYEIVVFTTQPFFIVEKTLEKLDPDRRFIAYQLFRESCRLEDGKLVKDLRYLNRDPRKVVVIDTDPDHVSLQPENAVILAPWTGNKDDRELVGMIPFLEAIGIYNVDDVRKTIKAYEGSHIPTEHLRRELEVKQRHDDEWRLKKERLGGLASLFGGVRSGSPTHDEPPKTWVEQERERFQHGYLEDQKFWRENGDKLRRQMHEEQEKQLREMKLNAWDGMSRIFGGAPPTPQPSS